MRASLPSGFAPGPRGRSLRVPKLSLCVGMAPQAHRGLLIFLSGARIGSATRRIGLSLVLRGTPLPGGFP